MIVKEIKETDPNQEFKVNIKAPHRSVFDDDREEEKLAAEREARRLAETIDDDEPDYVKDDEYGRTRLHAWVFVQK
jgi:hypothetical protein